MNTKFLPFLFLLLFPFLLKSQYFIKDDPGKLWWVNLGVGVLYEGAWDKSEFSSLVSFTKPITNNFLVMGRFTYAEEFQLFSPDNTPEIYRDLSLLAGLYAKGRFGFVSLGTGAGWNSGRIEEGITERKFSTIGLPVESQVFFTLPFIGIGLVGYGNINNVRSTWGFTVTLQFGNLR